MLEGDASIGPTGRQDRALGVSKCSSESYKTANIERGNRGFNSVSPKPFSVVVCKWAMSPVVSGRPTFEPSAAA